MPTLDWWPFKDTWTRLGKDKQENATECYQNDFAGFLLLIIFLDLGVGWTGSSEVMGVIWNSFGHV